LTFVLTLLGMWGCASAGRSGVRQCASDLARDTRSLNEALDSALLEQGVAGAWRQGAGLTLATLRYDSLGAVRGVRILTESFDDAGRVRLQEAVADAAHPEGTPGEGIDMVLGDERAAAPRRVARLRGCAPVILNNDQVTERLVEEARRLGIRHSTLIRLRARVGLDGKVEELRVDKSSGDPALDLAAVMVARGIRFRPALIEGFTVPDVWAAFPVRFSRARR
jgi:TonB family protein